MLGVLLIWLFIALIYCIGANCNSLTCFLFYIQYFITATLAFSFIYSFEWPEIYCSTMVYLGFFIICVFWSTRFEKVFLATLVFGSRVFVKITCMSVETVTIVELIFIVDLIPNTKTFEITHSFGSNKPLFFLRKRSFFCHLSSFLSNQTTTSTFLTSKYKPFIYEFK